MFTGKAIKIIGFFATAAAFGASLITDWVNEKKTDDKIAEKVNEAIANYRPQTEETEL